MESSPGTDQGDTQKKGRKKKGEKKPIPEMKLTVNVQQWLRKENGKAVEVNITDLQIDKTKERGQIGSITINYDNQLRRRCQESGGLPSTATTWTVARNDMEG